ncbi:hypothetical protein F2P79_001968 [Pimephales promelas]|nr:hypothetical protein F2P79_001968 [Pimephales promelas]
MKGLGSTWLQQQSPLLALWLHSNVPESFALNPLTTKYTRRWLKSRWVIGGASVLADQPLFVYCEAGSTDRAALFLRGWTKGEVGDSAHAAIRKYSIHPDRGFRSIQVIT